MNEYPLRPLEEENSPKTPATEYSGHTAVSNGQPTATQDADAVKAELSAASQEPPAATQQTVAQPAAEAQPQHGVGQPQQAAAQPYQTAMPSVPAGQGRQNTYYTNGNAGYYGSYYSGPYYGQNVYDTHRPQPTPRQPAVHTAGAGAGTATATKRKPMPKILGYVALLLVAAMCGFGGGYLANSTATGSDAVVYRATENGGLATRSDTVESLSVAEVAAMARDSVVSIITENVVTNPFTGGQIESGAGSGVIISENGYIITNNHVISGADSISVTLQDGSELDAQLVGTDPSSDIAVLKVEAEGLVPAVLGDSDALAVGDMCLAIGNPMGTLGGTVTDGIISALNREVTIDSTTMNLLQMSAAVSPGNSGGGLFNANGELIGVVNAKSSGSNSEGLGFAIPVNQAIQVAQDIIELGYVSGRPSMGVRVYYVSTAEQALQAGVGALGVYIDEVTSGGAAQEGGIQAGDRILYFNNAAIDSTTALTAAIQQCAVGDTVEVVVERGGEQLTLQITLQEKGPDA